MKEVISEKFNSVELNTFSTYLNSLLGVIAFVFSNHTITSEVTSFKIGTLVTILKAILLSIGLAWRKSVSAPLHMILQTWTVKFDLNKRLVIG